MELNEPSTRGHQMVGKMREKQSPAPFRHGFLALVNATKRYGGERGEYQDSGIPIVTPTQNQLHDSWELQLHKKCMRSHCTSGIQTWKPLSPQTRQHLLLLLLLQDDVILVNEFKW